MMKHFGKTAAHRYTMLLVRLRKATKAIKASRDQKQLHQATVKYLKHYDNGNVLATYIHNRFHVDYDSSAQQYYKDQSQTPLDIKDAKHIVMAGNRYHKHATSNHRWEARSRKNHESQRRSRLQSYAKYYITHPSSSVDEAWIKKQVKMRKAQLNA